MKTRLLIPAIIFLSSCLYLHADFNVNVNLKVNNFKGQQDTLCYFGVNTLATDSVDFNLGEADFPPAPAPGNSTLQAFLNMDTVGVPGIWTYKDYRSVPENQNEFYRQYKLMTFWGSGDSLRVYWGKLPVSIKSAYFTDIIGGLAISVDMQKQESVVIKNKSVDKFFVKVVYDKLSSIGTNPELNSSFCIAPNPVTDQFYILLDSITTYDIYNNAGKMVISGENKGPVEVNGLPAGLYIIKLKSADGKVLTEKFIKH